MTTNDEILRELGELKGEIKELREKKLDINKLFALLLQPKILLSIGFVIGITGVVGGSVAQLSGYGLTLSGADAVEANIAAMENSDTEEVAPELDP